MTAEELEKKRNELGPTTWAAQMMQNPLGRGIKTFEDDHWNVYFTRPSRRTLRVAIIIDSANAKKKSSDYTTMWVVGLGADWNYYILDGVHDRLNLSERTDALFALVKAWRPDNVFWEQVGAMSDAQHVRLEQDQRMWHFAITEIGQHVAKTDRIRWLQPTFQASRMWMPVKLIRRQADGEDRDIIQDLYRDEFQVHPVSRHDDMLDCLANIHHPDFVRLTDFPMPEDEKESQERNRPENDPWDPLRRRL
jgi:phage terminase large subunit-like protein